MGSAQGTHSSGDGQPRLQLWEGGRGPGLLPLLRRGGRRFWPRLLQLRPGHVAHHGHQQQSGHERRLTPRDVAARRPGGAPHHVRPRLLAPPALQLGRERQLAHGAADLAGAVRLWRGRRHQWSRPRLRALRTAGAHRRSRHRSGHPRIRRGHRRQLAVQLAGRPDCQQRGAQQRELRGHQDDPVAHEL